MGSLHETENITVLIYPTSNLNQILIKKTPVAREPPEIIKKSVASLFLSEYTAAMLTWEQNRKELIGLVEKIVNSVFFSNAPENDVCRPLLLQILEFYRQKQEGMLIGGFNAIYPGVKYSQPEYKTYQARLGALDRKLNSFYESDEGKKDSGNIPVRFFFAEQTKKNGKQKRDYRLLLRPNPDNSDETDGDSAKSKLFEYFGAIEARRIDSILATADIDGKSRILTAYHAARNETSSGYEITKEDVQKELDFLLLKLEELKKEKESYIKHGFGSANSTDGEISAISKRIEILQQDAVRIEQGYDCWDKVGFELECDSGGFEYISEAIGEIDNDMFRSNLNARMRMPTECHVHLRKAIDTKLFAKFFAYSVAEMTGFEPADRVKPFWHYYLFGTACSNEDSLFVITSWDAHDL